MSKLTKAELKKTIRTKYLEKRNVMDYEKRRAASEKIAEWVFANKRFKAAQTVFVYASFKSEVDTMKIIQRALQLGKRVAVPKVEGLRMEFYEIHSWEELFPGNFGILEPQVEDKQPVIPVDGDVMLVPGAVFDHQGSRIGYGKGYYDRYWNGIISTYGSKPYLIGLAYACQICPKKLPTEEHDKKMDCILTERRVIMPRVEKSGKLDIIADVVEIAIEVGVELIAELID
ncbi:MAG: 5-formyltetrahydrofolate cyclo-ligase [Lachnospiraceae bacterium]|nr:5-formyltetrahydrofolate cyclo-ligase [Lachnospiraceae bacterium]